MDYLPFLRSVHRLLAPKYYLEIGVNTGKSLAVSRCRSVGIDPAYVVSHELHCDVSLFRTSSDEYFARAEPLAATGGHRFDLTFIDGLHLFEFALRDFMNAERYGSAKSAIIFDDVLPRDVDEAARMRHTGMWTGDVYPIIEVLARYRPELTVLTVGTQPTGLLVVTGLDPDSTVLTDNYAQILAEFRRPDPQPVPPALMDRLTVLAPERVLASPFWDVLAAADETTPPEQIRSQLAERVRASLGAAFAA